MIFPYIFKLLERHSYRGKRREERVSSKFNFKTQIKSSLTPKIKNMSAWQILDGSRSKICKTEDNNKMPSFYRISSQFIWRNEFYENKLLLHELIIAEKKNWWHKRKILHFKSSRLIILVPFKRMKEEREREREKLARACWWCTFNVHT